jgi:hypothetical protein
VVKIFYSFFLFTRESDPEFEQTLVKLNVKFAFKFLGILLFHTEKRLPPTDSFGYS